jgi:hypothetical protein
MLAFDWNSLTRLAVLEREQFTNEGGLEPVPAVQQATGSLHFSIPSLDKGAGHSGKKRVDTK